MVREVATAWVTPAAVRAATASRAPASSRVPAARVGMMRSRKRAMVAAGSGAPSSTQVSSGGAPMRPAAQVRSGTGSPSAAAWASTARSVATSSAMGSNTTRRGNPGGGGDMPTG